MAASAVKRVKVEEESAVDFDLVRRVGMHNAFEESAFKIARQHYSTTPNGPYYFVVDAQPNAMTDPSTLEALTSISIHEVEANGTSKIIDAVAADYKGLGLLNHFAQLTFKIVRVSAGSNNWTCVSNFYWASSYIETLLGTSKSTKESTLTGRGYYMDVGSEYEIVDSTAMQKRRRFWAPGHAVDVVMPLHVDLATAQGKLPPGMSLTVEIERNDDEMCFMVAEAEKRTFKIVMDDLRIRVKQYTAADALRRDRNDLVNERWYLPYTRTEMGDFSIAPTETDINRDNQWSGNGPLPERVIVVMVDNESVAGTKKTNPLKLESTGFINAWLTQSGPNKIDIPFSEINVRDGGYGMASCYDKFQKAIGVTAEYDRDIGINLDDYSDGYFMIAWDLTSDACARAHFMHKPQYGTMGLKMQLAPSEGNFQRKTYRVFVYSVYPDILKIEEDGRTSTMIYKKDPELKL